MKYTIANVSGSELKVLGRTLHDKQTIQIDNPAPYLNFINNGLLSIHRNNVVQEQSIVNAPLVQQDIPHTNIQLNQLNQEQQDVLKALFTFYTGKDISEDDLTKIKHFYNDIGLTSCLPDEKKKLLLQANNKDEFIAVLINEIYPLFFYNDIKL